MNPKLNNIARIMGLNRSVLLREVNLRRAEERMTRKLTVVRHCQWNRGKEVVVVLMMSRSGSLGCILMKWEHCMTPQRFGWELFEVVWRQHRRRLAPEAESAKSYSLPSVYGSPHSPL